MKTFIVSMIASIVVYSIYFLGLSYFGPSLWVGANAGSLFVLAPILILAFLGVYFVVCKKRPAVVAGLSVGFLLCVILLQFIFAR
jgi:hypothetical protein